MKNQIREEILGVRLALDQEQIKIKSKIICNKFRQLPWIDQARTVMAYLPFRNEVDLVSLFDFFWAEGKKIVIPICDPGKRILFPSELQNVEQDLQPGTWGILESKPDKVRPVDPQAIDCIIVPGVAFDPCCNRLGYGRGFYDRFLPLLRQNIPLVGAAFQLQIVPSLNPGPYDIPLDGVLTEENEYYRTKICRNDF